MAEHDGFSGRDKYGDYYRQLEKTSSWIKQFTAKLRRNISSGLWNIVFTKHGEKRMVERSVEPHEVRRVLLSGRWKESRIYETRPDHERHVFQGVAKDGKHSIEVVFVIEAKVIVVTVWSEKK